MDKKQKFIEIFDKSTGVDVTSTVTVVTNINDYKAEIGEYSIQFTVGSDTKTIIATVIGAINWVSGK